MYGSITDLHKYVYKWEWDFRSFNVRTSSTLLWEMNVVLHILIGWNLPKTDVSSSFLTTIFPLYFTFPSQKEKITIYGTEYCVVHNNKELFFGLVFSFLCDAFKG